MTADLSAVLQANFPEGFLITDGRGTLLIRDAMAERGRGYLITVIQEFGHIEARLEFESFAGQLAAHAARQLKDQQNILKELLGKYPQLNIRLISQTTEDVISPESKKEDVWWLNFYCRLTNNEKADQFLFADILLGLIFLLLPYEMEGVAEGASIEEISKSYERSKVNRALCLAYHGYNCKACNTNMRQLYSGLTNDFIHVHHLNPVAISGTIKPDPIKDMVPLCPNCHGVAHLRNPPYTVTEIKNMIQPKL
jgi:hypothetical protein